MWSDAAKRTVMLKKAPAQIADDGAGAGCAGAGCNGLNGSSARLARADCVRESLAATACLDGFLPSCSRIPGATHHLLLHHHPRICSSSLPPLAALCSPPSSTPLVALLPVPLSSASLPFLRHSFTSPLSCITSSLLLMLLVSWGPSRRVFFILLFRWLTIFVF